MHTFIKFSVLAACLIITGVSYANCPVELDENHAMDCIVIEGAGDEYVVEVPVVDTKYATATVMGDGLQHQDMSDRKHINCE